MIFNIQLTDAVHAGILAAVGAAVSFIVSFSLNALANYVKKRWQQKHAAGK